MTSGLRRSMICAGISALAAPLCAGTVAAAGQSHAPLALEATIPLKAVSGRIDHLAFDAARKRLLVAELGNNSVDIIALASRQVVHRITGLKEPQGIAYIPATNLIVTANAADGDVRLFDGTSFAPRGNVSLGDDADNVRIDPHSGHVLVGYGDGGIAVLDPLRPAKLAGIVLGAHPESFQISPGLGRIFANIPDAHRIAVVDAASGKPIASWTPAGLRGNFPMALDEKAQAVIVVFRNPARIALLDMNSGAVRATAEACGDADDVFLDEKRQRIYVSCGTGYVEVLAREGLQPISQITTSSGARTSLYVPETDRLYLAVRAGLLSGDAAIEVYRPEP